MHMISKGGRRLARRINDTGYLRVLDSGDITGTDGRVYGRIFGDHVQLYNERGDCPIYPAWAVGHVDLDDGLCDGYGLYYAERRLEVHRYIDPSGHPSVIKYFTGRRVVAVD